MAVYTERCLFLAFVCICAEYVTGQAPCKLSEIAVQDNFDISKYMGLWYEVEWISPVFNDGGDAWINYYHVYKEDDFGVVTGYYSGKDPSSGQCYFGGIALLKTAADAAKLIQYQERRKTQEDYWVLETDYTTYAVVYSCVERETSDSDTCKTSRWWLWGRTTSLPDDIKNRTRTKFERLCMNMNNILVTDFVGEDCVPDGVSGSMAPRTTFTPALFAVYIIMNLYRKMLTY